MLSALKKSKRFRALKTKRKMQDITPANKNRMSVIREKNKLGNPCANDGNNYFFMVEAC